MDWSGVGYLWVIVMFLSTVWTLILTAPIHCRGSIGEILMSCYISPNLMKKQTPLHLGWLEYIFSKFLFLIYYYFILNLQPPSLKHPAYPSITADSNDAQRRRIKRWFKKCDNEKKCVKNKWFRILKKAVNFTEDNEG